MQTLAQALASNFLVVRNTTGSEVAVLYPKSQAKQPVFIGPYMPQIDLTVYAPIEAWSASKDLEGFAADGTLVCLTPDEVLAPDVIAVPPVPTGLSVPITTVNFGTVTTDSEDHPYLLFEFESTGTYTAPIKANVSMASSSTAKSTFDLSVDSTYSPGKGIQYWFINYPLIRQ